MIDGARPWVRDRKCVCLACGQRDAIKLQARTAYRLDDVVMAYTQRKLALCEECIQAAAKEIGT